MRSRDLTQGTIWKQLVLFAIPLLLGNLLQQLYNTFDAIVVGNYVSSEALAAVGSTGPLINMIIAFFMGMSTGASVLISQFFGGRDIKSLQDTVHTAMLLSLIMGVVLSGIGILVTPKMLEWMQTPPEVIADATTYLRVYFAGLTGLTVYNMGSAILTATGDSKRPLYFLMLSTVLNVVLDLVFVLVFHMGVAGVAWATVIAQIICAALVVVVLCKTTTPIRLSLRRLRISVPILKRIAIIGLPGGIQSAIISGSNILVQSYINRLGAGVAAGYSASSKLDAFLMLPSQTMAMAVTTFVGQNLGAKQVKRARQGVKIALVISLVITVVIGAIVLPLSKTFLRIFTPDPQVLEYGFQFMLVFVPGYILLCFTQILPSALRGAGDVKVPTITTIVCYVFVRQIYLYFVTQVTHSITTVALGYPLTWALAAIVIIIHYKRKSWDEFEPKPEPPASEGEEIAV